MKYYITGANGFIGKAVCEYLKGNDIEKLARNHWPIDFDSGSTVIHLSAYGNHSTQTGRVQIIQSNITALISLLDAFNFSRAVKFYNISSSSVTLPVHTMYSASKLLGEQIVNSYKDPRMVNVRPYSIYGPGEASHRFIPTVIRCLLTGEQMNLDTQAVHDWFYVDDFVKCMLTGYTEIGSGMQVTNMDIVNALQLISGKKLNYIAVKSIRDYDCDKWVCPAGAPGRLLLTGLTQTYEFFRTQNT